nr:hypothetical protein [Candidatus Korarchaeota archaeon]
MKIYLPSISTVAQWTLVPLITVALVLICPMRGRAQPLVDIAVSAGDLSNLTDGEPSIAVNPANPLQIAVVTFSG